MPKLINRTVEKIVQLLKGHGIAVITGVFLILLISVSVYLAVANNREESNNDLIDNDLSEPVEENNDLAEEEINIVNTIPPKDPDTVFSIEALLEQSGWSEPEEPEEPEEPDYFGVAYLTFDDGPSRAVTTGILDLLAEEEIPATFFIMLREDVDDIYQRILDEGHEIANHSSSHNYNRLYSRGLDVFRDDILNAHNFILDNYGYTMTTFRFPGGSMSWRRDTVRERIEVLDELGYTHFDWHIDSGDARPNDVDTSAETLTKNVLGNTNDIEHLIILMHDYRWRQSTLEALPAIIEGLRDIGYTFDIMRNFPTEDIAEENSVSGEE